MATRQAPRTTVTWIPSYVELAEHPKVRRLSEAIGESENEVLGILHRLWWYAARYAQDGNLDGFTDTELARACHVPPRKAAGFVEKLRQVGWLTDGKIINDWDEYAGRFIGKQVEARDRMRSRRASAGEANTVEPPISTRTVRGGTTRTVRAPLPNSSVTVRSNIREHKIIEQPNGNTPQAATIPGRALWSVFDTHLGTATTAAERGRRAAAVRDLVAADVPPDTLDAALRNWNKVMPGATCSETGVAANIGKLTRGFQATQATRPSTNGKAASAGTLAVLSRWQEATDGSDETGVLGGNGAIVGVLPVADTY